MGSMREIWSNDDMESLLDLVEYCTSHKLDEINANCIDAR